MNRNSIVVAIVAFGLGCAVATAKAEEDYGSANFMLPRCKAAVENDGAGDFIQGFCAGTVYGAAMLAGVSLRQNWLCMEIPDGVTPKQMVRVVVRYIEAWPQRMHEPFMTLTIMALHNAWPCGK